MFNLVFTLVFYLWINHKWTSAVSFIPACDDMIFCQGEILEKVQLNRVFEDAKTFVDMPLKKDRAEILPKLRSRLRGAQGKDQIRRIIQDYFDPAGTELSSITPKDWKKNITLLHKIRDKNYKLFAQRINEIWKDLTREMKTEVRDTPSRYSLIYSPNPFVVPGGRFREFYYWDTYWAISGLLLCDMPETVKGMILNFVDLIKNYGIIPNGGRIYYKNRSQPPFLTLMVKEYYNATRDIRLVKDVFRYLEAEYEFWMQNRSIVQPDPQRGNVSHTLNMFSTPMGYPRPESYWQDVETIKKAGVEKDERAKMELYSHIASAAESGWDFSSRWFNKSGTTHPSMTTIRTRKIIPVGLNSILCAVERSLSEFASMVGNTALEDKYKQAFERRKDAIEAVFWDEETNQWLDHDIEYNTKRSSFYVSNVYPLWAGCYEPNRTRVNAVLRSLKRQGVFKYPAGIPTSLQASDEQWDFPNAWPPLQDIAEIGLRESGSSEGEKLAFELAKKWLETNYISWRQSGHMHEKYNVNIKGQPGHGGEYKVQVGFGWTNGVVLKFLARYGDKLVAPPVSRGVREIQSFYFSILFILLTVFKDICL